jgi:hypothetical protein
MRNSVDSEVFYAKPISKILSMIIKTILKRPGRSLMNLLLRIGKALTLAKLT